jgi:formylglycine-generating enzyme required for sulfatase activity
MSETEITQTQWKSVMGKSALNHAIERVSDQTRFSRNGSTMTLQQMLGLKSPDELKTFESWFRPECPVFLVSAREADSFVQKVSASITETPLSDLPGSWRCALPSEAQWEFACRAGTVDASYVGPLIFKGKENSPTLSGIAWYRGNSSQDFSGPGWISNSWAERETPGDTAGVHPVGLKQPNPWGLRDMLGNVFEWCADTWRGDFPDGEVDPLPTSPNRDRVLRSASANSSASTLRCAFRVHEPADFRTLEVGFRVILEPIVE